MARVLTFNEYDITTNIPYTYTSIYIDGFLYGVSSSGLYKYDTIADEYTILNVSITNAMSCCYNDGYIYFIYAINDSYSSTYGWSVKCAIARYEISTNTLTMGYSTSQSTGGNNTTIENGFYYNGCLFGIGYSDYYSRTYIQKYIISTNTWYNYQNSGFSKFFVNKGISANSTEELPRYKFGYTWWRSSSQHSYSSGIYVLNTDTYNYTSNSVTSGTNAITTGYIINDYDLPMIVCGKTYTSYNTSTNNLKISTFNPNTYEQTELYTTTNPYYSYAAYYLNGQYTFLYGTHKLVISIIDYDLTYTIKDKSNEITYTSLTGQSPISKVKFNFAGSSVTFKFTTMTGDISSAYTPTLPAGVTLAGYAFSPNSTEIEIPLNVEVSTTIDTDTTFYEVYKKYVPPATTFNIELYQNTADKLVLDKTSFLTLIDTLSGALRDRCDIINPTIIIEYNSIPDFNYIHIPVWERYYYVDKIVSVRFGLWEISLTLDERFSYKDEILSQTDLLIARSESLNWYNPYLVDEMIPAESGSIKTVTEIPNTSLSSTESTYPFVVAVIGATP